MKAVKRIIAIAICVSLFFQQTGIAQVMPELGVPAYLNGYVAPDRFRPVQLRSIEINPAANDLNLYLDKGDARRLNNQEAEKTAQTFLEYLRIGIALPNSTFWVNLRPDSQDRIMDSALERTDLGKVLLEADLQLKKDLAKFTSPDTREGRQYWDKLYAKAGALFGEDEISIPTATRPWIVPGEIIMRQSKESAYIYKAALNVKLEQDWLTKEDSGLGVNMPLSSDKRIQEINGYSSELVRTLILPKLTAEVNSSKKYASLRQVYYALILAQWYKRQYKGKEGTYADQIDSRDLAGLTSQKSWSKTKYFDAYKRSFAHGEYNKEEMTPTASGMTVRQYFSGGILVGEPEIVSPFFDQANRSLTNPLIALNVMNGKPHAAVEYKGTPSSETGDGGALEEEKATAFLNEAYKERSLTNPKIEALLDKHHIETKRELSAVLRMVLAGPESKTVRQMLIAVGLAVAVIIPFDIALYLFAPDLTGLGIIPAILIPIYVLSKYFIKRVRIKSVVTEKMDSLDGGSNKTKKSDSGQSEQEERHNLLIKAFAHLGAAELHQPVGGNSDSKAKKDTDGGTTKGGFLEKSHVIANHILVSFHSAFVSSILMLDVSVILFVFASPETAVSLVFWMLGWQTGVSLHEMGHYLEAGNQNSLNKAAQEEYNKMSKAPLGQRALWYLKMYAQIPWGRFPGVLKYGNGLAASWKYDGPYNLAAAAAGPGMSKKLAIAAWPFAVTLIAGGLLTLNPVLTYAGRLFLGLAAVGTLDFYLADPGKYQEFQAQLKIAGDNIAAAEQQAKEQKAEEWLTRAAEIKKWMIEQKHQNLVFGDRNCAMGGRHTERQFPESNITMQESKFIPLVTDQDLAQTMTMACQTALKEVIEREPGGQVKGIGYEGGLAPYIKEDPSPEELKKLQAWGLDFVPELKLWRLMVEAIKAAGYRPGIDVVIALDPANSELQNAYREEKGIEDSVGMYYFWRSDRKVILSRDQMNKLFRYAIAEDGIPLIGIEDGFAEDDYPGWGLLMEWFDKAGFVIGDDVATTKDSTIEKLLRQGLINTALIKPNQIGTSVETMLAMLVVLAYGKELEPSHRSRSPVDPFEAYFAMGAKVVMVKFGGAQNPERTNKFSEIAKMFLRVALGHKREPRNKPEEWLKKVTIQNIMTKPEPTNAGTKTVSVEFELWDEYGKIGTFSGSTPLGTSAGTDEALHFNDSRILKNEYVAQKYPDLLDKQKDDTYKFKKGLATAAIEAKKDPQLLERFLKAKSEEGTAQTIASQNAFDLLKRFEGKSLFDLPTLLDLDRELLKAEVEKAIANGYLSKDATQEEKINYAQRKGQNGMNAILPISVAFLRLMQKKYGFTPEDMVQASMTYIALKAVNDNYKQVGYDLDFDQAMALLREFTASLQEKGEMVFPYLRKASGVYDFDATGTNQGFHQFLETTKIGLQGAPAAAAANADGGARDRSPKSPDDDILADLSLATNALGLKTGSAQNAERALNTPGDYEQEGLRLINQDSYERLLALAKEMLTKFPDSTLAASFKATAEFELGRGNTIDGGQTGPVLNTREDYEQEGLKLIDQVNYEKLLALAKDMLAKFPDSALANAFKATAEYELGIDIQIDGGSKEITGDRQAVYKAYVMKIFAKYLTGREKYSHDSNQSAALCAFMSVRSLDPSNQEDAAVFKALEGIVRESLNPVGGAPNELWERNQNIQRGYEKILAATIILRNYAPFADKEKPLSVDEMFPLLSAAFNTMVDNFLNEYTTKDETIKTTASFLIGLYGPGTSELSLVEKSPEFLISRLDTFSPRAQKYLVEAMRKKWATDGGTDRDLSMIPTKQILYKTAFLKFRGPELTEEIVRNRLATGSFTSLRSVLVDMEPIELLPDVDAPLMSFVEGILAAPLYAGLPQPRFDSASLRYQAIKIVLKNAHVFDKYNRNTDIFPAFAEALNAMAESPSSVENDRGKVAEAMSLMIETYGLKFLLQNIDRFESAALKSMMAGLTADTTDGGDTMSPDKKSLYRAAFLKKHALALTTGELESKNGRDSYEQILADMEQVDLRSGDDDAIIALVEAIRVAPLRTVAYERSYFASANLRLQAIKILLAHYQREKKQGLMDENALVSYRESVFPGFIEALEQLMDSKGVYSHDDADYKKREAAAMSLMVDTYNASFLELKLNAFQPGTVTLLMEVLKDGGGLTAEEQALLDAAKQSLDKTQQTPPAELGGVDFRAMPAAVQPIANPAMAAMVNPVLAKASLQDLDKKWSSIRSSIKKAAVPYSELKEYVAVCKCRQDAGRQLEQVQVYIGELLKLEEERAVQSTSQMREIVGMIG